MAEPILDHLGILGAGNMAEALTRGILAAGLVAPDAVLAADPQPLRRTVFEAMGVRTTDDPGRAAECSVVLLAVKPQILPEVLETVVERVRPDALLISIAAGVQSEAIAVRLQGKGRVVRVMPNTPMLVGAGVAGVAAGPGANPADVELVLRLFGAAGSAFAVEEPMLDAVTALSGSGPAYVFRFVEALTTAAEGLGLPSALAARAARETIIGAARLLAESEDSAAELRQRVTSPGGTTEAALKAFEAGGLAPLVAAAVTAARDRSIALAEAARS